MLTAEDVYTSMLRDNPSKVRPGASGWLDWKISADSCPAVHWEIRPNAVWRFGRVFLRCPRCWQLATRLYVPAPNTWEACRRCWGLTYESRQGRNYKPSPLARHLGLDSLAQWLTISARERRADAAATRYAERRATLDRAGRSKE